MKICVFTLGCRVNSYESDALVKRLREDGHEVYADGLIEAELYIVNTCAVTQEAERKSAQCVSRIKKLNKNARIIMCGCASQHSPDKFRKEGVSFVLGTASKLKIAELLDEVGESDFKIDDNYEECIAESTKAKAYIKVQDGCNNFCSYCIIPYLRGRSRSRRVENAVREILECTASEVVITGINLSAYGKERGESLVTLIDKLNDTDKRISLGSLSVALITREFLESLTRLKNFCPHFHISLQSGSDKVLRDMNRKYTRDEYLNAVKLIREYFDSPSITTDIIVGFPTEDEKAFEDSMNLAKECAFADIHIFPYSPRSGTNAYKLGRLDGTLVSKRVERITVLRDNLRKEYIKSQLNKHTYVLIEEEQDGYHVGYSDRYVRVYLQGDYRAGDIISVEPVEEYKDGLKA